MAENCLVIVHARLGPSPHVSAKTLKHQASFRVEPVNSQKDGGCPVPSGLLPSPAPQSSGQGLPA